jgi:hypothetical protein
MEARHFGVRSMPRGIVRVAVRPLLAGGIFAILLMFIFEREVDSALELAGYDRNFISYFPFVRNLYFRFVLYYRGAGNLDVAHFHMLDVTVLLSIVVWGGWLTAGFIFLKYDNGFQLFCNRVAERFRGRELFLYFSWIFALSGPIILSITPRVPVTNPEMLFLLTYIPRLYFFVVAIAYYFFGGFLYSLSILFVVWKVFCQNRPRLVALERAQKEEADHEQA